MGTRLLDPAQRDALHRNHLLSLLDEPVLAALAGDLTWVELPLRFYMMVEGKPIRYVYFPVEGVGSMLASADERHMQIEIGTIGREGMVGLPLALGATQAPGDCFAQVSGAAWRMPAAAFRRAMEEQPSLAGVLHRYAQAFTVLVSQSTACNRIHSPRERCARWLLMTHDRVDGDRFDLTQEFLSQMLGERRPTVSRVASELQERGWIRYSRGSITLLNRRRLEEAACPCYLQARKYYASLLGDAHAGHG